MYMIIYVRVIIYVCVKPFSFLGKSHEFGPVTVLFSKQCLLKDKAVH